MFRAYAMRDFVEERALLADALLFGFLLAPSPILTLTLIILNVILKLLELLSQNRNRTRNPTVLG